MLRYPELVVPALFAFFWVVLRAHLQSVTIDEADGYLGPVAVKAWPAYWYPTSGNHVLHSILVRLITQIFGLSHLTLRAGALIGAGIYIHAIARLCLLFTGDRVLGLALFTCLVYHPLVMDYMVAARGYSLALALLVTALWLLGRGLVNRETSSRDRIWASVCIGLSFSANFSFAYVDLACLAVHYAMAGRPRLRNAVELFAPAGLVALVLCGSVVAEWPRGQLYYGADSFRETWRSLVASTFPNLNEFLVNNLLRPPLERMRHFLPGLLIAVSFSELVLAGLRGRDGLLRFVIYATCVPVLALLLHWVQWKLFQIPLPMERTALFFAVAPLLAFGALTAMSPRSGPPGIFRGAAICVLIAGAIYFIGSLRLNYFLEWKFGADVREAFPIVQQLAKRCNVREISTTWDYQASMNFYRVLYNDSILEELHAAEPSPGKAIYLIRWEYHHNFAEQQRLKIVYKGPVSDLAVGIAPGVCPE